MRGTVANQSGFTLIEVMIALLILLVGLMSAAVMQTRAIKDTNESNRLSERLMTAEEWMEDLMSRPIKQESELAVDPFFADLDDTTGVWQDVSPQSDSIPVKVKYRGIKSYPLENLTTIEVMVEPVGVSSETIVQKRIVIPYIRSTRWN